MQTRLGDRYPGQNYINWLKQSLRENKPYDVLVRELVTLGNAAAGLHARRMELRQRLESGDHHPKVFSGLRAGGGIRGGRAWGASDERGRGNAWASSAVGMRPTRDG